MTVEERDVVAALVEKLDEVAASPDFKARFLDAKAFGYSEYVGPNWVAELEAVRALVREPIPGEGAANTHGSR